jgi:hypothetical protein
VGLKIPRSRLINVIPASPACGYSRESGNGLKGMSGGLRADSQCRFHGVQTDLRIRMTVAIEQHASLIPLTRIQFILDIYHLIEQAVELRCFVSEQCFVLLNSDSDEPLRQLIHGHVFVRAFHGENVTGSACQDIWTFDPTAKWA